MDLMQEGYVPSWCTACYRKGECRAVPCLAVLCRAVHSRRLSMPMPFACHPPPAANPPTAPPPPAAAAGRTGEHFMQIAKAGNIHNFCHPNSLFTLQEYLVREGGRE